MIIKKIIIIITNMYFRLTTYDLCCMINTYMYISISLYMLQFRFILNVHIKLKTLFILIYVF